MKEYVMVAIENRFRTASTPCPICEGYDRMRRGNGERCYGFVCDDPEYVFCTNEKMAGALDRSDAGYNHKLHGQCKCGKQHNPPRSQPHLKVVDKAPKKETAI